MPTRERRHSPRHLSTAQITTRIDPESARLLGVIAAREMRSVSAQLAHLVENFIAAERKKTADE